MSKYSEKDFFLLGAARAHLEIPLRDRVKILLLRLGQSQNWLAEQCEVSSATMSQIVNEKWIPSSRLLVRISDVLEIDSVCLFGDFKYWREWRENVDYRREKQDD